jgi:hypothetical protein
MIHVLAPALAVIVLAANPQPPEGDVPQGGPTSSAVVGGHHIQPRGGGSSADVPKGDAAEVDRLYQELMRETAPDAGDPTTTKPPRKP